MNGGYGKAQTDDYSKNSEKYSSSDESSDSEDIEERPGRVSVDKSFERDHQQL